MREQPLLLTGRALVRGARGALELGEPLDVEVGDGVVSEVRPFDRRRDVPRVGNPDAVLIPGLSDSHAHVLATAAGRTGVDLSRDRPERIQALVDRLAAGAASLAPGAWLRASGHDESFLAERRHPTLVELDRALPAHPLRLRHATRHATVLNTRALAIVEQRLGSLGPEVAPRDDAGRSTGLVLGLEEELTALVPPVERDSLDAALATLGRELAAHGIACIEDLSASNDAKRVALLADAVQAGWLPQRVRAYVRDSDVVDAARRAAHGDVEIVGVKLLARAAEEAREPAFRDRLARARRAGLPVAVHAVEPDVIDAALAAFEEAPPRAASSSRMPDRIEHCSLCPPELVERLSRAKIAVVTQPCFLALRGDKYRREVEPPLWPWLYPLRSLRSAGILVAAGSDSPVASPDPRHGLRGAMLRCTPDGTVLGEQERIPEADALDLYTGAAARLRGEAWPARWPFAGVRADIAVCEGDLAGEALRRLVAHSMVIGGRVHDGASA